jgi:hypothetical protein
VAAGFLGVFVARPNDPLLWVGTESIHDIAGLSTLGTKSKLLSSKSAISFPGKLSVLVRSVLPRIKTSIT